MKTIILPDGRKITYDGTLDEKIRILEMMGVSFTPSPAEQAASVRKLGARANAKAIPDWASYDEATALQWLLDNIGTPLNATIPPNPMTVQQIRATLVNIVAVMQKQYAVDRAYARMIIAFRNEIWEDLQDV